MKAFLARNHKWLLFFAVLGIVYALGIWLGASPIAAGGVFAVPFLMAAAGPQIGPNDQSGTTLWPNAGDKGSFFSATPVVQPVGATQAALAAGANYDHWLFYTPLADIADGDLLTAFVPGFAGTLVAFDAWVEKAATTAAKASSLNLEIGATNTTGGVVALTSANCTPKGVKVAGSAITGANAFSATDAISIEAASTTAFVEGAIWMDITYAKTGVSDLLTAVRTALVNLGLMKGAA